MSSEDQTKYNLGQFCGAIPTLIWVSSAEPFLQEPRAPSSVGNRQQAIQPCICQQERSPNPVQRRARRFLSLYSMAHADKQVAMEINTGICRECDLHQGRLSCPAKSSMLPLQVGILSAIMSPTAVPLRVSVFKLVD